MRIQRRLHRRSVFSTIATFVAIAAASAVVRSQEIPKRGTFTGRWEVVGKAMKIDLGSRVVSIAKFDGAIVLEGDVQGLSRGFRAECVGMLDDETGSVGRCVWKDRFDDEIWSELGSRSTDAARTSRGTLVGGTGKFEGIEGDFTFNWLYMVPATGDGAVRGYSTDISGGWRLP